MRYKSLVGTSPVYLSSLSSSHSCYFSRLSMHPALVTQVGCNKKSLKLSCIIHHRNVACFTTHSRLLHKRPLSASPVQAHTQRAPEACRECYQCGHIHNRLKRLTHLGTCVFSMYRACDFVATSRPLADRHVSCNHNSVSCKPNVQDASIGELVITNAAIAAQSSLQQRQKNGVASEDMLPRKSGFRFLSPLNRFCLCYMITYYIQS